MLHMYDELGIRMKNNSLTKTQYCITLDNVSRIQYLKSHFLLNEKKTLSPFYVTDIRT